MRWRVSEDKAKQWPHYDLPPVGGISQYSGGDLTHEDSQNFGISSIDFPARSRYSWYSINLLTRKYPMFEELLLSIEYFIDCKIADEAQGTIHEAVDLIQAKERLQKSLGDINYRLQQIEK